MMPIRASRTRWWNRIPDDVDGVEMTCFCGARFAGVHHLDLTLDVHIPAVQLELPGTFLAQ